MKVILQRGVEKLGIPGDVVEVADGYANNYLFPRGLATRATKGATTHAERLRRAHDARVRKAAEAALAMSERLSASRILLRARAGEDGRLFGSITVADVARELQAATGAAIDRRRIEMSQPIRSVGTHELTVHLHPEVRAGVTLEVLPE